MDTGNDKHRLLIENLPEAFAYHQVVTDSEGEPVDYIFLDVNRAFEEMTGLSREQVKGKKVTELHPGIGNSGFDWIDTYGRVAFTGRSISLEQYSELLGRWYAVTAYSDEPGYFAVFFRDITTRKQAEDELRKSEEKYRLLAENANDVIWTTDLDLNYTYISPSAEHMSGYTVEERMSMGIYNILTPSSLEQVLQGVQEELELEASGEADPSRTRTIEVEQYRKDGSTVWVEVKVSFLRDREGRPYGILGITRDISDRKKVEQALKANEERYRLLVENIGDLIFSVTDQGVFTYVSPNSEAFLGYKATDLTGRSFVEFVHPDDVSNISVKLQEVINCYRETAGKYTKQVTVEYRARHANGQWRWISAKNAILKVTKSGYEMVTVARDITEQRENEIALRESEEKFRTLFDQNIVAIYLHDFQGNIIDVNNQACLQLGYSYEELLEMSVFDFIYTKERGGYLTKEEIMHMWHQMDVEKRTTVEDVLQRKDGTIFYVEVSIGAISYNNQNVIMALAKDITDRKRAEEKIRYMSFHDSLTGLYNRYYLEEEMQRLDTERQLPISIIMVDLNGLKLVNDVYGHKTGDEMLKNAAEIIKKSCRREDIVGRWGGDEFVILLPQTPVEEVETINKRIKGNCRGVNVKGVPVSFAAGSGTKDSREKNLEAVLKEAEDSMYRQKLAEQKSVRGSVLNTLLKALKAKSYETEEHTMRMVSLACKIGEKIGLADTELNRLKLVINLHDIGKINIPETTLTKEGSLTDEEWEIIKTHPEYLL